MPAAARASVGVAIVVSFLLGCSVRAEDAGTATPTESATGTNPFEGKPDAIEAGRSIYSNTCLFCHGANGMGARAPNLVKGIFRPVGGGDDATIFGIILGGRPGTIMGGFEGSLSPDEIWKVMAYLRDEGHKAALQKTKKKGPPNP